eukprot:403727-Hanusia_phi.AAC.2
MQLMLRELYQDCMTLKQVRCGKIIVFSLLLQPLLSPPLCSPHLSSSPHLPLLSSKLLSHPPHLLFNASLTHCDDHLVVASLPPLTLSFKVCDLNFTGLSKALKKYNKSLKQAGQVSLDACEIRACEKRVDTATARQCQSSRS